MTKNVGDGCWWRNMLDIFGHSRKQHLMNQKWFLNNILESERKTGFDWFNFDLEIELLTLWIFYLIQSNFIKFTLKNILNTFLHIVTITCVFVGKLWQFLVELFVVSKWRNLKIRWSQAKNAMMENGIVRLEVAMGFDRTKSRCWAIIDDLHSLKYT